MKHLLLLLTAFTLLFSTNSNGNPKWSIKIMCSPTYSYRALFLNKSKAGLFTDENKTLIEYRNEIEKPIIGFMGGIKTNYEINSKFQLETGILYSKQGEKMPFYFTDNDPIDPRNGFVYTSPIEKVVIYTYYHFLDLPVNLSYSYATFNKFKFYMNLGVSPSLFLHYNAYNVYHYTNAPKEKVSTSYKFYQSIKRINLKGSASTGIEYDLKKLNLFCYPEFIYTFLPIANDPIEEHLYSIGIFIGVRYNLN